MQKHFATQHANHLQDCHVFDTLLATQVSQAATEQTGRHLLLSEIRTGKVIQKESMRK